MSKADEKVIHIEILRVNYVRDNYKRFSTINQNTYRNTVSLENTVFLLFLHSPICTNKIL